MDEGLPQGAVRTDRDRDASVTQDIQGRLGDEAGAEHKHLTAARETRQATD